MRYAIFSDVHANQESLDVVLVFYRKQNIDKYIFLGDIVGYGADPNEAISALGKLKPVCVAGNHEWGIIGKFALDNFTDRAKAALLWTMRHLSRQSREYLRGFDLSYEEEDFICVHGSVREPEKFHYIFNLIDAQKDAQFFNKTICFVGHSHKVQAYRFSPDGHTAEDLLRGKNGGSSSSSRITIDPQSKYIINVGSAGQPRDRDPRAAVCVYDSSRQEVITQRLEYDIAKAASKIINAGLPRFLAMRLYEGY